MDRNRNKNNAVNSEGLTKTDYEEVVYWIGDCKIDPDRRLVMRPAGAGEEPIVGRISLNKLKALARLASDAPKKVSVEELFDIVGQARVSANYVMIVAHHITELRRLLGDVGKKDIIINVSGKKKKPGEPASGGAYYLNVTPSFEAPVRVTGAPYLGARRFTFDHAALFFGRDRAVREMTRRIHTAAAEGCAFLLVTGLGGAGKSSAVQAGVLPSLMRQPPAPASHWRQVVVEYDTRVQNPFEELATALVRTVPEMNEIPQRREVSIVELLTQHLMQTPQAAAGTLLDVFFAKVARRIVGGRTQPDFSLVLVIDQLEALFAGPSVSRSTVDALMLVLDDLARSGWCYVIATVRLDYIAQCLEHNVLGPMLEHRGRLSTLRKPDPFELREMITGPAHRANIEFEVDENGLSLADAIVADAANLESLTVLGHVLAELHRSCPNKRLTFARYRHIGGLSGCVSRQCDALLEALGADAQAAAMPTVLTRLTQLTAHPDNPIVAKSARWKTLTATPAAKHLVQQFCDAQLFTVSRDDVTGERMVALAHEAVLTAWDTAVTWIRNNQSQLRVHQEVARKTEEWLKEEEHSDLLLTQGQLENAGPLLVSDFPLTMQERRFIELSALTQKVRNRRRTIAYAAVATAALLFAALSAVTFRLWRQAEGQRHAAESVTEFMISAFEQAMPYSTGGETVTARDLLDSNVQRVRNDSTLALEQKASILRAIGRAYGSIGDADLGVPPLEEALAIRRQHFSSDRVPLAEVLRSLGWVLARYDIDPARGEALLREAIGIWRELAPEQGIKLSTTLHHLAIVLSRRGDYDAAEDIYREALALRRTLVGPGDPGLASITGGLGHLLTMRQRLDQAEPLLRDTLAIKRQAYGADDPRLSGAINLFAVWLYNAGRFEEATPYYREALAIRTRAYGIEHRDVALSMSSLGKNLTQLGELAEAIPLLRDAVRIAIDTQGEDHRFVAIYQTNLAEALLLSGDTESAIAAATSARQFYDRTQSVAAWRVAVTDSVFGAALAAAGQCVRAEPLLLNAHQQLVSATGAESQRAVAAQERLQQFLYKNDLCALPESK